MSESNYDRAMQMQELEKQIGFRGGEDVVWQAWLLSRAWWPEGIGKQDELLKAKGDERRRTLEEYEVELRDSRGFGVRQLEDLVNTWIVQEVVGKDETVGAGGVKKVWVKLVQELGEMELRNPDLRKMGREVVERFFNKYSREVEFAEADMRTLWSSENSNDGGNQWESIFKPVAKKLAMGEELYFPYKK